MTVLYPKLQPLAGNMNMDHVRGNVAISTQLGLDEAISGRRYDDYSTIAIVNPGPSAKSPEALLELSYGFDDGRPMITVLAGTGYRMLNNGISKADAVVLHHPDSKFVQALPDLGMREEELGKKPTYFISSMAAAGHDPDNASVFDVLQSKGRDIKLWHAHVEGGPDYGPDKVAVGTGSGAPIAVLALFSAMGARHFRIYGMDGSAEYAVDLGDSKAMQDYLASLEENQMAVRVGDQVFTVAKDFWPQTQELIKFVQDYPDAVNSLYFSGNTANAAIFNTPDGKPNLDIEILPAPANPASGRDFTP